MRLGRQLLVEAYIRQLGQLFYFVSIPIIRGVYGYVDLVFFWF